MLLAAGYFRARIPKLHPFDKMLGGLAWCIISSNVEVDVDLHFDEDMTLGEFLCTLHLSQETQTANFDSDREFKAKKAVTSRSNRQGTRSNWAKTSSPPLRR